MPFLETHGEKHIVEVLGALHIEKAAWSCLCQVKDGCWSTTLLAEGEVTTIDVAESCIHWTYITCGCCINTAACVLFKFLPEAYDRYLVDASKSEKSAFGDWYESKKSVIFRYHYFLLIMKLLLLQFVRSAHSGNMKVHPASITRLTYYLFAINYPNYAQWASAHIHNILLLPIMHL